MDVEDLEGDLAGETRCGERLVGLGAPSVSFAVAFPKEQIDDLRDRLVRTRWIPELPGAGWDRGVPVSYLKGLAEYWATTFDWQAAEAELNRWPQFLFDYDGQPIHFRHVRSQTPEALPLLLLHDNPGGIAGFLDVLEPLSQHFHLVVPTTPGFGYSSPLASTGWTVPRTADAVIALMAALGYDRYGAQGAGGGANLALEIGRQAPDRVAGLHLNAWVPFPDDNTDDLTETEMARLAAIDTFMRDGFGFNVIQSTRPQTIAYGLHDSPTAQLAWVVEKFKEWTDPSSKLPEDAFSRDTILIDASVQWFTQTSETIAQIYYDNAHDPNAWGAKGFVAAPVAAAVARADVTIRRFAERDANVVRWTEFEHGGAYLALEHPALFVQDLVNFFTEITAN